MSFAKEIYTANNGDTISATISSTNLTRIEIEGQKIIKDYSAATVSKKITEPLGQVYLVPNQETPFNLYIVSDSGNTYNLHLTPQKKVAGDSIVIKPAGNTHKAKALAFNSESYIRKLNYLLKMMYLNQEAGGDYSVHSENQQFASYDGLESILYKTYQNEEFIGQVLLIKNVSREELRLTEGQFYSEGSLAIALEHPELKVNGFSRIFIIKGAL